MTTSAFSFTLTIPASKKVYYSGKRRRYASMNHKAQYTFLNALMLKIIFSAHFDMIDWVFEEHEDGRLHIHGYAIVCEEFKHLAPVEFLVNLFYTHNSIVGITSTEVIKRLSNIQKTQVDIKYWLEYMEKNQDKIKFYSPYRQEEIERNNYYTVPYVSIERKEDKPKQWYDEIINGDLSPIERDKTYKFKKEKFIVEF